MPRQFAALGLARAARIVEGMRYLMHGGYVDLAESHGRSVIEVYALSMYTLYGGPAAYEHVRGAHVRDVGLLPETPELASAKQLQQRWGGPTDKIKWEHLIKSVLPALVPDGTTPAGQRWFALLYDLSYRGYSTGGVHASVGSIARHLVRRRGSVGVDESRYEADDGTRHLLLAGTLLAMLASHVYREFGLSAAGPERLLADIGYDITEEELVIEGTWE